MSAATCALARTAKERVTAYVEGDRTRNGFDVAERKPGKSDLRFSWRAVARPKSAKHKRFAKTSTVRAKSRSSATCALPFTRDALPRFSDTLWRKCWTLCRP